MADYIEPVERSALFEPAARRSSSPWGRGHLRQKPAVEDATGRRLLSPSNPDIRAALTLRVDPHRHVIALEHLPEQVGHRVQIRSYQMPHRAKGKVIAHRRDHPWRNADTSVINCARRR